MFIEHNVRTERLGGTSLLQKSNVFLVERLLFEILFAADAGKREHGDQRECKVPAEVRRGDHDRAVIVVCMLVVRVN